MELFLFGAGLGVVGGLFPSPLHFIALAQVALHRWLRALCILVGVPLILDGALLLVTLFFYQYIPRHISHYVAYAGGLLLIGFAVYSLFESRRKSKDDLQESSTLTYAGVTAAALAELAAPGTWIYWLTIAGPILAEIPRKGYLHVVPFFVGSLVGYYGAAVFSLCALAWGAGLHVRFKHNLFLVANILLLLLGISYLIRAVRLR